MGQSVENLPQELWIVKNKIKKFVSSFADTIPSVTKI